MRAITINTPELFRAALAEVFAKTDFDKIGQVKDHMKPSDPNDKDSEKIPTGDVFLTGQIRMPAGSPLHIGGTDFYPNTLQVKIDGFKLSAVAGEKSQSTAKAATSNADMLKAKLGLKPGAVVAVPPVKAPEETPVS